MVSRTELLAQAERRYTSFLRALVTGEPFFPLELRLGKTRRAAEYPAYQNELAELRAAARQLGIVVQWENVKGSRFGLHERPTRAAFAHEEEYLRAVGKSDEVRAFRDDLSAIRTACPSLEEWLPNNLRKVVSAHGLWPRLLRVVCWFGENPRCGKYLRQLPIPGIDTKFFELNSGLLDELITSAFPENVHVQYSRFSERHGLHREEPLIRVRFLDPILQQARGFPVDDLALPAPSFRSLPLEGVRVIITENLRNFLALPRLAETVAVFGGGNAVTLLAGADWLTKSAILYWGDIDAHGFVMLSRLRDAFPNAASVLMDAETLAAARDFVGTASPALASHLPSLTTSEAHLFGTLRNGSVGLEQERLPWPFVLEKLSAAITALPRVAIALPDV